MRAERSLLKSLHLISSRVGANELSHLLSPLLLHLRLISLTSLLKFHFTTSRAPTDSILILSSEMGGALSKFWAWWQYSDREGSYPDPCSPSSSSFVSCDELEKFNTEAAEIHESSSSTATNYDVFLSFSGQDTRLSFTGHLYNALVKDGVLTFKDEEELKKGEEIASSLIKAVAESRISIPIFSTNYASSKWCLNELVEIMKSRDTMGQIVFPIFYNVNPRDVRKQTGSFGQQFDELAKKMDPEKVESWKKALKQAGSLKGHDLKTMYNGNESKLIERVVRNVLFELRETSYGVLENLVGINSWVEELFDLLNLESKDVKIIGIWGMGGIGKTTVATVIFNKIRHSFEGSIFLEDIREEASKQPKGLVDLQKQLLAATLKQEISYISNVNEGKSLIQKYLRAKKVVIVLDNVDSIEQLEALAGRSSWFGPGSRILITTRDAHKLNWSKVDGIYEAKELDFNYSLQLFSKHAFGTNQPPHDFLNFAKDTVHIAGGLPLALEVLGKFLCDKKDSTVWTSTLNRLKKVPREEIEGKLKISYDGLDEFDKEIFLDIACFFVGTNKEYTTDIWEGCGFSAAVGITNLIQRALIKIGDDNELGMHDQLRDMGRHIACQGTVNEPGNHSRLWFREDILKVLKGRQGTENVKGLALKFEGLFGIDEETALENHFNTEEFEAMSTLRLLQIDNMHLNGDFKKLPSQLRWLSWKGCPLESIPIDFCLEKLAVLDLSRSRIKQVWNDLDQNKRFQELKALNLNKCEHLTKTPVFSRLPGLEKLNLQGCIKLEELESSVCKLKSLKILNLSGCSSLNNLPDLNEYMEDLEVLDLSWCQCLTKTPDLSGLTNIEALNLEGCIKLEKLHGSICKLKSLKNLNLSGCLNLNKLPGLREALKELKVLNLSRCQRLTKTPDFSRLLNLEILNLEGCIELRKIPRSICNLKSLKKFILSGSSNVNELPDFYGSLEELEVLKLDNCKLPCRSPDLIGNMRNLMTLSLDGTSITELPNAVGLLEKMKRLSVKHCSNLIKLPDSMGTMKILTEFSADETSIVKLPEDFGMLSSLEQLSMANCREFRSFPENFGSLVRLRILDVGGNSKLAKLPISFSGLGSLQTLYATRCNLSEGGIPSDFGKLPSLSRLDLSHNNFCRLPASINALSALSILKLEYCRNLQYLPEMPSKLSWMDVRNCISLERLSDLSNLKDVGGIMLSNCKKLAEIKGIEETEGVPFLVMNGCSKALLKSVNKGLGVLPLPFPSSSLAHRIFSGSEIPAWFTPMKISDARVENWGTFRKVHRLDCEEVGSRLWNPQHHLKIIGVIVSFVSLLQGPSEYHIWFFYNRNGSPVPRILYNNNIISDGLVYPNSREDQINMLYFNEHHQFVSNLEEGDGISFVIHSTGEMEIKKAGVHVFYQDTKEATILRMEDFFTRLPHNDDDVDGGEASCREITRFKLFDLHDDGGEPSRSRKRKLQALDHDDNDDDDADVGGVNSSKRTKFQLLDHDHDDDDDDDDDGDGDDDDDDVCGASSLVNKR